MSAARYSTLGVKLLLDPAKRNSSSINDTLIEVYEMGSCILVSTCLLERRKPETFAMIMKFWSKLMITLMETNSKPDMYSRIKTLIRKYIQIASTALHLYQFIDLIITEVSQHF